MSTLRLFDIIIFDMLLDAVLCPEYNTVWADCLTLFNIWNVALTWFGHDIWGIIILNRSPPNLYDD